MNSILQNCDMETVENIVFAFVGTAENYPEFANDETVSTLKAMVYVAARNTWAKRDKLLELLDKVSE